MNRGALLLPHIKMVRYQKWLQSLKYFTTDALHIITYDSSESRIDHGLAISWLKNANCHIVYHIKWLTWDFVIVISDLVRGRFLELRDLITDVQQYCVCAVPPSRATIGATIKGHHRGDRLVSLTIRLDLFCLQLQCFRICRVSFWLVWYNLICFCHLGWVGLITLVPNLSRFNPKMKSHFVFTGSGTRWKAGRRLPVIHKQASSQSWNIKYIGQHISQNMRFA